MIIKPQKSVSPDIEKLESLLDLDLTANQKENVNKEIRALKRGHKGEQDSAYFIDFKLNESKNWAVIHDLRVELNGYTAQIDHLLINRCLEFYVLETKNFFNGLKINPNGEFLTWYRGKYHSIESPIEQNERHINLLKSIIKNSDFMPKRLGLSLSPDFKSLVLISPKSRLILPEKCDVDISMVVKADSFFTKIQKDMDNFLDSVNPVKVLSSAGKLCSSKTIMSLAQQLIGLHQPIEIDYRKKFSIVDQPEKQKPKQTVPRTRKPPKRYFCETCGKEIELKVARFCWFNKARFHEKVLCRECQKKFT